MRIKWIGEGGKCWGEMDDALPDFVKEFVSKNEELVAKEIESWAMNSAGFADKTGKLRSKIKAYPSKFVDGGWIVGAWAPHAWLVEFGHEMIDWRTGRKLETDVPAHPFLRPALQQGIASAYGKFGVK